MQLTETAKVRLLIDGKEAISELTVMESKFIDVNNAKKEFTRGSKEWKELNNEAKELKVTIGLLRERMDVTNMTFQEANKYQRDLKTAMKGLGNETEDYIKGAAKLKEVNTHLAKLSKDFNAVEGEVKQTKSTWDNLKGWIAGAFTIYAIESFLTKIWDVGKGVFDITAKFERYDAVLANATQSTALAAKAMGDIKEMAATTPFTVDELTDSYVKFANRGLMPTKEEMKAMANVAATTGKSFEQLSEALLDGAMGQLKRFTELGISAEKMGDKIKLSFKGVSTTVSMDLKGMTEAMSYFNENAKGVATATDVMSKTMEGRMSNLQDLFDFARVELGNKLKPMFSSLIDIMYKMVEGLKFVAQNFERIGVIVKTVTAAFAIYHVGIRLESTLLVINNGLMVARKILYGQYLLMLEAVTGMTVAETQAQLAATAAARSFNATIAANPFMVVLGALTLLVAGYQMYKMNVEDAQRKHDELNKRVAEGIAPLMLEKEQFNQLAKEVLNTNLKLEDRKTKLDELKKKYPDNLKGINDLKDAEQKLGAVIRDTNKDFVIRAKMLENEVKINYNNSLATTAIQERIRLENQLKNTKDYGKVDFGGNVIMSNDVAIIKEKIAAQDKLVQTTQKNNAALAKYSDDLTKKVKFDYKEQTAAVVANAEGTGKAGKKKKDDAEKTFREMMEDRLKNEKLEVEAMEKSFEKEMELNGIAYELKKVAAQKEIKDKELLNQRLIILVNEYNTKKLEIEKKYADLERSYLTISNTRIESSVKKLHLASVDLKEWEVKRKGDLDKRLEQIDEDEKKRKENLIKLEEQRIDLAISVFNYGTNDQPVVQSLGNIAGAYQKLLTAQKNGMATAQDNVNVFMAIADAAKQIMSAINEHRENNKEILSSAYKAAGDVFRDFSDRVRKYMVVDYKAQLQEQLKASEGHFEAQKKLLDAYAAKVKETMTDAFADTDFSEEVGTAMDSIFEEMANFTPPGSMGLFDKIPFLSEWKEEKFAEDVDDYFKKLGYSSMEGAFQFVDDTEKVLEALEAQKDGLEFYYSEMVRITREKYGQMSDEVNSNLSAQLASLNTWYEGQRDVINDIYSDILNNVVVYQDDIFDATMTGWDASKKAAEDSLLGEKGITEENYDELIGIRKDHYQKWKDTVNQQHNDKMADLKAQLDAGVITQQQYDDAVVLAKGVLKQRLDAIDAKIKTDRDADLLDLKQNYLDKKVEAEQAAADKISEINRKMNADIAGFESAKKSEVLRINYEMFEAERKMALANLDIQEVISIAKIIAANPLFHKNKVNEIKGMFAENRAKISGASNPYGAEITTNSAAPENRNDYTPPSNDNGDGAQSFSRGGMFKDSSYFENHGVLGGLSHNTPEGGNWVINPRTKKILAKVEANEWIGVVNKNVTSRYGTLLEQLSRSSVATTGRPVYAEDGYFGVLDESSSKNAVYGLAETQVGNMALLVQKMERQIEQTSRLIDTVSATLPILSSVADSSNRTAAKEMSININNIIEAADIVADVDSRSRFA